MSERIPLPAGNARTPATRSRNVAKRLLTRQHGADVCEMGVSPTSRRFRAEIAVQDADARVEILRAQWPG